MRNILLFLGLYCLWVFIVMSFYAMALGKHWFFEFVGFSYIDLFTACFLTPLWEEALYRYGPITIAKEINPKTIIPVVVMSSLLFGWNHNYGLWGIIIQGILGFCCAAVFILNKHSYLSAVTLHSLWNLIAILLFDNFYLG